jgi:hypothetical protein
MQVCISAASLAEHCNHGAHRMGICSQETFTSTSRSAWSIPPFKDSHFLHTPATDRQRKKEHAVEGKLGRGLSSLGIVQSPLSQTLYKVRAHGRIDRNRTQTDNKKGTDKGQYTPKYEHASRACPGNDAMSPRPYVSSSSIVGHLMLTLDIGLASIIKRFAVGTEQTSKHYSEMM